MGAIDLYAEEQKRKKKKKPLPSPDTYVKTPRKSSPAKDYSTPPPSKENPDRKRRTKDRVKRAKTVTHPSLGADQTRFSNELSKRTGLNPKVIAGMVASEQPADSPSIEGSQNWLNIGYYDEGPGAPTKDEGFFGSPEQAAKLTAKFLKGKRLGASEGIQDILKSKDKGKGKQIKAIQESGWASSGHPNLPELAGEAKRGKAPKPKKAVLKALPKSVRSEGRHDERTPSENESVGGSVTSDHLTTNDGYAADIPPDDKIAKKIAKRLGLDSHTGINEITKDGIRYQLIWQAPGHYDHIHLGARPASGSSSSHTPSPSAGGSPDGNSAAPGKTSRKRRTKGKVKRSHKKATRVADTYADEGYYTLPPELIPSELEKILAGTKVRPKIKLNL